MKANYKAATGNTGPEVRTNLLQPERFKMITDEGDRFLDHPIVAVETKGKDGKHFYTLDTQFVGPVRMDRLTQKAKSKNKKTGKIKEEVPQPNLRPATVGNVTLGDQVGTIRVGKKEHPLYDYIEVDATASAPEGMGSAQNFNEGGMAMKDQMDVVFKSSRAGYALGGDVDEIDPVSGNEVPPGSTPKEVRDDRSEGTRLNSSHGYISYAVFCLKKKKKTDKKKKKKRKQYHYYHHSTHNTRSR